jgi:alpha-mannosidase
MLRSATAPDPEQDRGEHDFSFAVMPHMGRMLESGVYGDALRFTNDVYARIAPAEHLGNLGKTSISVTGPQAKGILVDNVKRGEDDQKLGTRSVILRMFEGQGGRATGTLRM